jgi:hypothetical protein
MATEAKKITQYPEIDSATPDDLILIVNDPAGVPANRKLALKNLFGNSSVNVAITSISPANSTMTAVQAGKIFYDVDYLYIAVDDNLIKRVPLSLF